MTTKYGLLITADVVVNESNMTSAITGKADINKNVTHVAYNAATVIDAMRLDE